MASISLDLLNPTGSEEVCDVFLQTLNKRGGLSAWSSRSDSGRARVIDVTRNGSNDLGIRVESFQTPLRDLSRPLYDECALRIIFLERFVHNLAELEQFSQYHRIPAPFWDQSDSGSFGSRTTIDGNSTRRGSWLALLGKALKPVSKGELISELEKDFIWHYSAYYLQQTARENEPNSKSQAIFICVNASESLRTGIVEVVCQGTSVNPALCSILDDAYHLYTIVLSYAKERELAVFWEIVQHIHEIENVLGLPRNPDYAKHSQLNPRLPHIDFPFMHYLVRQIITYLETQEVAAGLVTQMVNHHQKLYPDIRGKNNGIAALHAQEMLEAHMTAYSVAVTRVTTLEKRMENLVNLGFNIVQQRDAKFQQRDSNSMSAITILTLFFLPGTAIATIFSMPFFDPQDDGIHLYASFKYFWAITTPITALVVVVWLVMRHRNNEKMNQTTGFGLKR